MSKRFPPGIKYAWLAVVLMVLATTLPEISVAKESAPSRYWELATLVSTVIFDGRPAGLLTVVPVVDVGAGKTVDDAMERQTLLVQDRFLLGLNRYATTGFNPRTPIDILQIKKILQEELDKAIGAGKGTVYITSAHIAQRKN